MSLDGKDRLALRDPPRNPGEPLRVADRLDVQHQDSRARVLLPDLEQIVRRDVRTLAKRGETRDPEPSSRGMSEQRDPDRSRLRADRQTPGRHAKARKGCVQAHARVGVEHPQAVRADQAHPGGAHDLQQRLLPLVRLIGPRPRFRPCSTSSAFAPFSAASRATSTTSAGGTAITTSSGASSSPAMLGATRIDRITPPARVDRRPPRLENGRRSRLTRPPRRDPQGRPLAPTIAIELGASTDRIDATTPAWSRSSIRSHTLSVGVMSSTP